MAKVRLSFLAAARTVIRAARPPLVLLLVLMAGQTSLASETPASQNHRLSVKTTDDRLQPMPQVHVSLLQVEDGATREVAEQMSNDKGKPSLKSAMAPTNCALPSRVSCLS